MQLTLCEKTGTITLEQPGLMAGEQAGTQADEMLEIIKIVYWMKHWNFSGVQKGTVSL